MNFFSRLFGTFFDPGRTFKSVAEHPKWVDALVVLLICLAVYSYIVFPLAQKDGLRFMEDNAAKFKEKWGEAGYEAGLERVKNRNRALTSFLVTPLLFLVGFLFSALIVLGMGRLTSTEGNYLQVFSSLLHANFIDKILGNGLRLFLALSRESVVQTSTGLPIFFPKMDVMSPAYAVLSQVDFFQFWMFGLFGLGLAQSFKVSTRKALAISFGFWALKSLFMIALALVRIRMMQ